MFKEFIKLKRENCKGCLKISDLHNCIDNYNDSFFLKNLIVNNYINNKIKKEDYILLMKWLKQL